MKKHTIAALLAVCLLCAAVLGGCSSPRQGTDASQSENALPEQTTQAPFTIDSIRTAQFADVPAYSLYYDAACYMVYYGLMDAVDGEFQPYTMVTRAQGAEILCRLTDASAQAPAEPDAPLTRAQLAAMLYSIAGDLGCSTQVTGTELPWSDADGVDSQHNEALLWVAENGIFRCFAGDALLPDIAVSRLQLAQAVIGLKALDPQDALAAKINEGLPARSTQSAARQNHDAIQAAVDAAAEKYGAAGVQVAVIENGIVTDTYTYGWATKDTDPMTAHHKLRIASISKVAVGITAQLLREDGIIDLDADISDYWGCTVKNAEHPDIPITLRQMLTHTSSIINAGDDTSRLYSKVREKLQSGGFSSAVPGQISDWYYNNYAFSVLGMTLELASNRIADDILNEKLYAPMDIDAAFGSGDIKNTELLATIYRSNGEVGRSVEEAKKLHSDTTPGGNGTFFAGGMTTSVYDLAKLIALLAGDGMYEGVQLLQSASVELMESLYSQEQVTGGSYQAMPMRYWPDLYGREGIYFHTGSAYGVFNAATYDPVTRDGVVVLTTGASGEKDEYGIYKVCAEINQEIYSVIQ